ncbi:MAG TPA: MFS transporter [Caulobacteraceae bacterium]|jgi:MFS family permease|nr:MFS transporter [Caulobacteraceae bacterium]
MAAQTLRGAPGYTRFWWASSVSDFGDYFTSLAIQVLVVSVLAGTAAQVGLVSASRWLPYMLFGLVAGAMIDRAPRRPVMIAADLVRAGLLIAVPAMALSHRLSIWALTGFMLMFGLASLLGDAATQAFVPRLVPRALLTRAHARIDQSAAVAQTSGPALAGAMVSLVGAPWAVVVDAATYLFSAGMLTGIDLAEPKPEPSGSRSIWREAAAGAAYVYRHRTLAPMAISTHAWFVCNAAAGAVFAPFVLRTLRAPPVALGLAVSAAGIGGLVGSLYATRLGERLGAGRAIIGCRALTAAGFGLLALGMSGWIGWFDVIAGQFVIGLSMGAENANEMGYRQSVTPDELQGRMNATMRSINRAMIVFAAPLGGFVADRIGYRTTLGLAAAGFALVALGMTLTPFRDARIEQDDPSFRAK